MVCSSTPDYTWFEHINYTNELIFLTILRNLSRLWWQKKDTISKSLQQPFKRRRGDGYIQISCLSKGLNATWAYGVISSYSYLQKNIFPLWTHSSLQHDGGLLGVPVALSQQPEHSSASTGAWTWRCSQCGPNILSHEGDSQIPVTHLLQEFAEPSTISFSFFFLFLEREILPLVLMAVSILAASLSGSKSGAGTTVGNKGSWPWEVKARSKITVLLLTS